MTARASNRGYQLVTGYVANYFCSQLMTFSTYMYRSAEWRGGWCAGPAQTFRSSSPSLNWRPSICLHRLAFRPTKQGQDRTGPVTWRPGGPVQSRNFYRARCGRTIRNIYGPALLVRICATRTFCYFSSYVTLYLWELNIWCVFKYVILHIIWLV